MISNKINIPNPGSQLYQIYNNKLRRDHAMSSLSLDVLKPLEINDAMYLILGEPGNFQTELIEVIGTEFLDNKYFLNLQYFTSQDHTQNTQLYLTQFKYIELWVSLDGGSSYSLVNGEPYKIQWDSYSTEITDISALSYSTQAKYQFNYLGKGGRTPRENISASDTGSYNYSEELLTGRDLVRELKMNILSNPNDNTIPDSLALLYLNDTNTEIGYDIAVEDKHFFESIYHIFAHKDIREYRLPNNLIQILDVRINGCIAEKTNLTQEPNKCDACGYPIEVCKTEKAKPVWNCRCKRWDNPMMECPDKPVCEPNPHYMYYINGNSIGITPLPKGNITIEIRYNGMPDVIDLDKQIYLPRGYREVLRLGATYRYYFSQGKDANTQALAQNTLSLYKSRLNSLRMFIAERTAFIRKNPSPAITHSDSFSNRYNNIIYYGTEFKF